MDVLSVSLEPRPFQALLNGLIKMLFYDQKDITHEFLAEQLYENKEQIDSTQINNEIEIFEKILNRAAQQNWDVTKLVSFLEQHSLSEDYVLVMKAVWLKESEKIHKALLKQVTWNNSVERLAWRVDVRAISKSSAEVDEPVAFFDLSTKGPAPAAGLQQGGASSSTDGVSKSVQFEMNRSEVGTMLRELEAIQNVFDAAAT